MAEENIIDQPTVEIDGKPYVVKFSRAALYRLDKAGFDLRTLAGELRSWIPKTPNDIGNVRLSVLVDVLYAAIGPQFRGTAEDLAELITPEQTIPIAVALIQSIAKMGLSSKAKLREVGASEAGAAVQ